MSQAPPQIAEVTEEMVARALKPRPATSRKGENGAVAVVGGSRLYHGAPALAALAALRSGVDLVYIGVPKMIATAVRSLTPNFIVIPLPDAKLTVGCVNRLLKWLPKVDSAVVGPGAGRQSAEGMKLLVDELLTRGARVLLDADALMAEVVARLKGKPSVITPHAGEFKRVFGVDLVEPFEERAGIVLDEASQSGTTILLKGPVDIISDGVRVTLNRTGSCGMTVGGTGDILSGLVAGLMARGSEPFDAAVAGAYLNGLAGERAVERLGFHITATDIIGELPYAMKKFDREVKA